MDALPFPLVVLVLIVPGQALLFSFAAVPAALSRERFRARLGLVRGRVHPVFAPALLLATLVPLGFSEWLAFRLFEEPSDHLEWLTGLIVGPRGLSAVLMYVAFTLLPGTCEELFFRGYVQQRLQRRAPPLLAIGLPAAVFALLHMDGMHVVTVFPLGLWFGFVAWGTGSVWPAIACHVFNNAFAIAMTRLYPAAERSSEVFPVWVAPAALAAFLIVVPWLVWARVRRP